MSRKKNPYDVLSATARHVLYTIVDAAEKQQPISRTIPLYRKDIALLTGLSPRRVSEVVRELIDTEYISVEKTLNERGSNVASKFTILNPDRNRHNKIKVASQASKIPISRMTEYVNWISYHRDKLEAEDNPTLVHIQRYGHCPVEESQSLMVGLVNAGIVKVIPNGGGVRVEF